MEIKASTTYTFKILRDFHYFHSFHAQSTKIIFSSTIILLVILLMTQNLVTSMPMIFALLSIMIVLPAMFLLSPYFTIKKKNKLLGTTQNYVFRRADFTCRKDGGDGSDAKTIAYSDVFRLFETKTFFYIYLSKYVAYLVDKSSMKPGEIKSLKDCFAKKIDARKLKFEK